MFFFDDTKFMTFSKDYIDQTIGDMFDAVLLLKSLAIMRKEVLGHSPEELEEISIKLNKAYLSLCLKRFDDRKKGLDVHDQLKKETLVTLAGFAWPEELSKT